MGALIGGVADVGKAAMTPPANNSAASSLFSGGFQGLGDTGWVVNFGNKGQGINDSRGGAAVAGSPGAVAGIPTWALIAGAGVVCLILLR